MHMTPIGVSLLLDAPLLLRRQHRVAPCAPVGGIGAPTLLVHRSVVEAAGAEEVTCGDLGLSGGVVWIGSPVAVIDLDQVTLVIGIGVAAVANEERIVAIAAIEVFARAVGRILDNAVFTACRAPNVGMLALVVDGVVGRTVGEPVTQPIGVIHIGVDRALRMRGLPQRRRRRQRVGVGRGGLGRRRGLGQRQAGDRGPGYGTCGFLVACGERKARGGGGQEDVAV